MCASTFCTLSSGFIVLDAVGVCSWNINAFIIRYLIILSVSTTEAIGLVVIALCRGTLKRRRTVIKTVEWSVLDVLALSIKELLSNHTTLLLSSNLHVRK